MSESSKYPLQTDVATREFQRLKALRASTSQYGMTKLSNATDITDVNSAALSAIENNPNIPNTLKYQCNQLSDKLNNIHYLSKGISVGNKCWIRILSYSGSNSWTTGISLADIHLTRHWTNGTPEVHRFTVMRGAQIANIGNVLNFGSCQIQQFRIMYSGTNFVGYDIYYALPESNFIYCDIELRTPNSMRHFVDEPMKIVDESPTGESLYKTFGLLS